MTTKSFRRRYRLLFHPMRCEICNDFKNIQMHHIIPVHIDQSLQFDINNIVRLCKMHHFRIGHLSNWNNYNENVVLDIQKIKLFTKQYL